MQVQESCDLLEVPKIEAPFPVKAGPHAEEVQRRHMQWADDHDGFRSEGERRRFGAMDIGALADLLYPDASSLKDVQLIADWCAWLLLRDDRWDATADPKEWERLAERDRAYLRLGLLHNSRGTPFVLNLKTASVRETVRNNGVPLAGS